MGEYTIDKTGTVTGPDNCELVADLQGLHSLKAAKAEYDTPTTSEADDMPDNMTFEEELGAGRQRREDPQGESGPMPGDVPDQHQLTIEVPAAGFTPETLENLSRLVTAKEALLKAALGAEALPIQHTGETIQIRRMPEDITGTAL